MSENKGAVDHKAMSKELLRKKLRFEAGCKNPSKAIDDLIQIVVHLAFNEKPEP